MGCKQPRCCIEEVKESIAFHSKASKIRPKAKVLVDCCGGHGMIGLVFLIHRHVQRAVIADLKFRESFENILNGWKSLLPQNLHDTNGMDSTTAGDDLSLSSCDA